MREVASGVIESIYSLIAQINEYCRRDNGDWGNRQFKKRGHTGVAWIRWGPWGPAVRICGMGQMCRMRNIDGVFSHEIGRKGIQHQHCALLF